jgi:uncharacterized protein (DUF2147 family)
VPLDLIKCAQAAIYSIAFGLSVTGALAQAVNPPNATPVGLWRNIDDKTGQAKAEIRISASAAGVLTGVIEKPLIKPAELLCSLCSDDRKDKPKLGMEIIRGAVKAEGKDVWDGGKILDPDNGKNYTLRLTPIEGGSKLEVRGSIGPFGRTQTWLRVQ